MHHLLFAGLAGHGEGYLRKLDRYLLEWCAHTEDHRQFAERCDRLLNAGIRLRADGWPTLFYSFLGSEYFRDATIVLMLAAFAQHGTYLRNHHRTDGNHMIMEITGLATLATAFPEFKGAAEWLDYVHNRASEEAARQFYPEGVQKELCQNYHSIVIRDFERLAKLFDRNGMDTDARIHEMIYKGWDHLAYTAKPNGHGLLLNDANDQSFEQMIRSRAQTYERADWLYIYANGREGVEPERGPSVVYPWSGRVISRNGWHRQAQWSVFDIGPWGIGHEHNDKLHLSIHAHGRDLLVDSGRYTYRDYATTDPRNKRGYVRRSWGHNVVLVDGQSQNDDVAEYSRPVESYRIGEDHTFAMGCFDKGWYGHRKGTHTRAVVYVTDRFWLVCDSLELDNPATVQALWHLHPDCTADLQGTTLLTTDRGCGNLRLTPVPVDNSDWNAQVVKGRTEPTLQGWYSPEQNELVPSPCAVYERNIQHSAQFAWLITTGKDTAPEYEAVVLSCADNVMEVRISQEGTPLYTAKIDLSNPDQATERFTLVRH